jgi:SAM-dependent methyltransferase
MRFVKVAWLLAGCTLYAAAQTGRAPDVPYVPSPQEVVDKMLELAGVKSSDVLYDLGCGDGRIVITAAKKYGAHATGVDINPERIQEARANAEKAGVLKLVNFVEGDLFQADVSKASVVTLYLLPGVNLKLRPRLLTQLRQGSRIVSHSFDMGDWKPVKTAEVNGRTIYLWVVPPHAEAAAIAARPTPSPY